MTYKMKLLILGVSVLALAGCATGPQFSSVQLPPTQEGPFSRVTPASDRMQEETGTDDRAVPVIYRGDDRVVNMPSARPPMTLYGEDVSLNFEQAPITEVVHAVLGDLLELDYVIEHPVSGEITLRTRTPVSRDELLPILESLLQAHGAVMIRDRNGRYFVGSSGNLSGLLPGVEAPGSNAAGFSNVIIPLQFIGAREMADILASVASDSAFVHVDSTRNLLVLAGTRNQIDGWMELINTFDVDLLKGMSVGVFRLEYASVSEVAGAVNALMSGSSAESELAQTTLAGVVRLIPVERLNSILIVSPRAHYLDQIRTWIERLDQAPDSNFENQLFVYPVQNGSALHLAKLLSDLFGGTGGAAVRDSGVAPGLTPSFGSTSSDSESGMGGTQTDSQRTTRAADAESANFQVGEGMKVVADGQSNALLIYAKRSDYKKVEAALKRLDLAPTQVLIEANIIEVSLRDKLEYGLQWHLQNGLGGSRRGSSLLNTSDGPIGPTQGFSFTVTNAVGDIRAVLNALAEDSLVNVISSPSVLVLDNHTATIQVGDQQPVRSSQSETEGGRITTSIEYRDTGVNLSVTPSVNAGGMVNMDIKQSFTEVGVQDPITGQVSFKERNIESRVAIRSGETVVLGGLIRDNTVNGRIGVPVLHGLPVVGNLFGSTANLREKTELMVIITPRVLVNEQQLRDVSNEIRSRMQGLKRFEESLQ